MLRARAGCAQALYTDFGTGAQRLRDGQRVGERREDQRAGRERLDVDQIGQRGRRRGEHPVAGQQALLRQVRLGHCPARGERDAGRADRPDPVSVRRDTPLRSAASSAAVTPPSAGTHSRGGASAVLAASSA